MTNLAFWAVWTTISGIGIKYSADTLLDKDISFLSSIIMILVYQWIRFIKPPDTKQTSTTKPKTTVKKTK